MNRCSLRKSCEGSLGKKREKVEKKTKKRKKEKKEMTCRVSQKITDF
jgi:hypothetical protein